MRCRARMDGKRQRSCPLDVIDAERINEEWPQREVVELELIADGSAAASAWHNIEFCMPPAAIEGDGIEPRDQVPTRKLYVRRQLSQSQTA